MATAFTLHCLLAIQEMPITITIATTQVGATKQAPTPTKVSATTGVISMAMANTSTAANISTTAAVQPRDIALTPLSDQATALVSFQAVRTNRLTKPITL